MDFPQALAPISGYSSDESRLGDDAVEDELGASVNVRRVDVVIRIPRMSLAVRMYNLVNGFEPEQILSDVDEGAGVRCSSTGLRGQHLEVSVLPNGKHQCPKSKLGAERELHVESPRCHGIPGWILNASPLPGVTLSMSDRQILGIGSRETR
jgi:hypothetical protein